MRLSREKLLQELESVQPGLSPREVMEQSNCFVFSGGQVMTYNDEVACIRECCLTVEGAVKAEPLLKILNKLPEEELEVYSNDDCSELIIKGKRRKMAITMEAEILLPIKEVPQPTKWKNLPEEFSDAVDTVSQCASKDESARGLVNVHLTAKHMEACDNMQMVRFNLETPIKNNCLIDGDSIRNVIALGMTKFAESSNWIHFKNKSGLMLFCRRNVEFAEDFPDLTDYLYSRGGQETELPLGIVDAAEKAYIFSSENVDNDQIKIQMKKGKVRITGQSSSGWYEEVKSMKYDGRPLSFMITPKMLTAILEKNTTCEITDNLMRVETARFVYVTSIGVE